jgi:site-specific DNA-methyltransferase (adenine-specific)/modification methylase
MKPFYQRDGITIYCGDCREILPSLEVDLLLGDPPYGAGKKLYGDASNTRSNLTQAFDYPMIYDDDKPFDPSHLLGFKKVILWGGNYFANKLPDTSSWLVWDKRDGLTSNDQADCEIAWSNIGGPARLFRHRWYGMIKDSEKDQRRVHPTQKPAALMSWCIGLAKPQGLIVDPYMGSGSTLEAAYKSGHEVVGIEIMAEYCEIAVRRLSSLPLRLTQRATDGGESPAKLVVSSPEMFPVSEGSRRPARRR